LYRIGGGKKTCIGFNAAKMSHFFSESRSMQRKARDEVRRILEEQEKLSNELDEKMRKLDTWSRDLNKREVLTDQERQKLEEDKKKVMSITFFGNQYMPIVNIFYC